MGIPPVTPQGASAPGSLHISTAGLGQSLSNGANQLTTSAGQQWNAHFSGTSNWAIAAIISACLVPFTGVSFIFAIVFGHMALAETKRNPALGGRGLAKAALGIGYALGALAILAILIPLLLGGIDLLTTLLPFFHH